MKIRLLAAACALTTATYFPVAAESADPGSPPTSDAAARPLDSLGDVRPLYVLSDAELDTISGGQGLFGLVLAIGGALAAAPSIGRSIGNGLCEFFTCNQPPPMRPPRPPRGPIIIVVPLPPR
jgi:hypothetical protein